MHLLQAEAVGVDHHRHVVLEAHQLAGYAGLIGEFDQFFAPLRLFDLAGPRQQRIEVAILLDQLGRSLDADARHARHVVNRVAGERLHVDDLVRRHTELLDHFVAAYRFVLHRVQHDDTRLDQLHQVLVGRDDGDVATTRDRVAGVGRDQIVGLEAILLDGGNVERLHSIADQRELWNQLFRRGRAVRLVLVVDLVAIVIAAGIEDDGDVGRPAPGFGIGNQLPEHGAEAVHGADRQAVGRPRQGRQRMEGAENVAGPVDQVDVAALADGHGLAIGNRDAGFIGAVGRREGGVAFRWLGHRPSIGPPSGTVSLGSRGLQRLWG